jgi:hypothetical protein
MAKYGIAETTRVTGKCFDFIFTAPIENGSVVAKGTLVTGERNIYNATVPTVGSEIFLVANPAWNYDDSSLLLKNEDQYINPANRPFRVYGLLDINHDRFAVLDYSITPAQSGGEDVDPAIGDYIGVDGTTMKLKNLGTTAPTVATTGFIGKIIEIEDLTYQRITGTAGTIIMGGKKIVIEVIKNKNV